MLNSFVKDGHEHYGSVKLETTKQDVSKTEWKVTS